MRTILLAMLIASCPWIGTQSAAYGADDTAGVTWSYDFRTALKQGKAPLLVEVTSEGDIQTQMAEETLFHDAAVLDAVRALQPVRVWSGDDVIEAYRLPAPAGFLITDPSGHRLDWLPVFSSPDEFVSGVHDALNSLHRVGELQQRLAGTPDDTAARGALLVELTKCGDYESAAGEAQRLQPDALSPESLSAWRLATAWQEISDRKWSAAADHLNQYMAAAKQPTSDAVRWLILALQRSDREADALDLCTRWAGTVPEEERPEWLVRLSQMLHAAGRDDEARRVERTILDKYSDSREAVSMILAAGMRVWFSSGDRVTAQRLLQQVVNSKHADLAAVAADRLEQMAAEERWIQDAQRPTPASRLICLVPDVPTFLRVLSYWDDKQCFPILIEDTWYAPRFIAAYLARVPREAVVRVARVASVASAAPVTMSDARRAVYAAWTGLNFNSFSEASDDMLAALVRRDPHPGNGIVLTSGDSPQLAAAAALAAGRHEMLMEINPAPGYKAVISQEQTLQINQQVIDFAERYKLPWSGWGDAVDFLTICTPLPARYRVEQGLIPGTRAVDDALGRRTDRKRFAYVGRLVGDPVQSVYQAMCSLFLAPSHALLFNTYSTRRGTVWAQYATAKAAILLAGGTAADIEDADANLQAWHTQLFPPRNFDLFVINSAGGRTDWRIGGGGGVTDDVPVVAPALVHFTHSGSATDPTDPDSICGRWLENGAFAYFGSQSEPYLTAFVSPSEFAPLLRRGWPIGAAFRRMYGDNFWTPWRLWLLGDPLFSSGGSVNPRDFTLPPPQDLARMEVTVASTQSPIEAAHNALLVDSPERCLEELNRLTPAPEELAGQVLELRLQCWQQLGRWSEILQVPQDELNHSTPRARILFRGAVVHAMQMEIDAKNANAAVDLFDRSLDCIADTSIDLTLARRVDGVITAGTPAADRFRQCCADLRKTMKNAGQRAVLDKLLAGLTSGRN